MKVAVILGTRPEIIKLSPVIRALIKEKIPFVLIHTNQHYSKEMDKIFFKDLKLPQPDYNLGISGARGHGEMTGKMLIKIEKVLLKEKPDVVVVQGDTNTTLAGALAAVKLHIKTAHVEAGLRSYDRKMPEEINRVITDHISDFLFAPTENQKRILINEGINQEKIFVTGNTVVDAVFQNLKIAEEKGFKNKYKKDSYFLLTLHRPENVDYKEKLLLIIKLLEEAYAKFKIPYFFPIHPRTEKNINLFKIRLDRKIFNVVKPISYLEMLVAIKNAKAVLTDSGGLQEESCILKVPCITIRISTERPETIEVGANVLVDIRQHSLLNFLKDVLNKPRTWKNPFGDGQSGKRITRILREYYSL